MAVYVGSSRHFPNFRNSYVEIYYGMGVHTHNTAGFTIFPTFVALVHKNPYVGHYLSCRRFGKEPPRRPLTRPHLPSVFLFFLLCHFVFRERHTMMARGYGRFYRLWCCHPRCDRCRFITTPWVTPPTFGFVVIDGGGRELPTVPPTPFRRFYALRQPSTDLAGRNCMWRCHPRCDCCRFIHTPCATPPTFGFVGIDGWRRVIGGVLLV